MKKKARAYKKHNDLKERKERRRKRKLVAIRRNKKLRLTTPNMVACVVAGCLSVDELRKVSANYRLIECSVEQLEKMSISDFDILIIADPDNIPDEMFGFLKEITAKAWRSLVA